MNTSGEGPADEGAAMWRLADTSEDDEVVQMCRDLYAEDPAPMPVPESHTRQTLAVLREEPIRGRVLVLSVNGAIAGYSILASFWSNELGGEVIVIDELYVRPAYRRQGYGAALLRDLAEGERLWPRRAVALELEVTPQNSRAAGLYARVGFRPVKNARLRLLRKG